MKNILIACQSCGYLIKDVANAFALNNNVTLLASRASINRIENELSNGVNTSFVIAYNKSSVIKRIFTWSVCVLQMLLKILFCYKNSEVLYVSNPPFCTLLPLVLKNRFSILIWDIYPDVLINQHMISEHSIIAEFWKKANRNVFIRADHIFTISDGMKDCLSQYVSKEKIKVIPLWPDKSNLEKVNKSDNLFIKDNNLVGKFIVMYSGNMGYTHRVDVLLDVAKRINDEDVVFVMIGDGGKKKVIEQRVNREKIKNVILLPYQPYDFLSHSLSAADIAVVTLDTNSASMSVPSKTFNMISLGIPLLCIASPQSELGNIVRKYDIGKLFLPENVDDIIEYILQIKNNGSLREQYSLNSLNASKNFTSENVKMFIY